MDLADYRQLWDYSYWARDRLIAVARGLDESNYAAENGFIYPSVRSVMTHLLGAENLWLARWRGDELRRIPPDEVPTVEAMEQRWAEVEGRMRAFLAELTPAALAADVEIRARDGTVSRSPMNETMTMMLFHQAQHRSEAAEALSHVDRSPGELDFLLYLKEKGR